MSDEAGGAESIALQLFRGYREKGHDSFLSVGYKKGRHAAIAVLDHERYRGAWARTCLGAARSLALSGKTTTGTRLLRGLLNRIAQPRRWLEMQRGREDFDFPATWHLLAPYNPKPDILHCHNLHGGYFDLRAIPSLSRTLPVVMTLHDAWLLGGHCAHSFECEQWETGCGTCPGLAISPSIKRDAASYNRQTKKEILSQARLYVATPSDWLMKKVQKSIVSQALIEARVIPNGIDLSLFTPGNREESRDVLGLPKDSNVVLFAAHGIRENPWKDYTALRAAIEVLASKKNNRKLLFVALGDTGEEEKRENVSLRFVPLERRERVVAGYFRAADLYVHPARIDTFPTSILEALACGTPVVATRVGGIVEQIEEGVTGYLVEPGDAHAIAHGIEQLLGDDDLRRRMGVRGAEVAERRYDRKHQADEYLGWYEKIIEEWGRTPS